MNVKMKFIKMKRAILLLVTVLLFFGTYAQAPEKMSYQTVIYNKANHLLIDTKVDMQISILQGLRL